MPMARRSMKQKVEASHKVTLLIAMPSNKVWDLCQSGRPI